MKRALNCLVVDDDPMFNMVAQSVLESLCDGRIVTAGSGREGLATLTADKAAFDIVFLDLNMPDVDGLAFMRAAAEAGFSGRIVISSGEADPIVGSARIMGEMLGISIAGTIRKPLKIDQVSAILAAGQIPAPASRDLLGLGDGDFDLVPFYQPQYDIASGRLEGLEALVRLKTRDGRAHGPSRLFDSIDDRSDLTELCLTIAGKVLDDLADWSAQGLEPMVSINFDAGMLEQPEVGDRILALVRGAGIDPNRICLELTEKSLPHDPVCLIEALTRLRMSGFHLALDDYGTGASSYKLLRLCPFSELKLDRSIVSEAVTDAATRTFLRSSVEIAHALGIRTVAEGVENEDELETVRAAGMDRVQGFLFSRPAPAAEMLELLAARRPPLPRLARGGAACR